jgi:pilus assembly protein CpaB
MIMRGKTFVAILFGVSLLVAAFVVMNFTGRGDASLPQQQVLASTVELSAGTLLRAQDVTWQVATQLGADQIVHPSAAQIQAKPGIVEETAASIYGAVLRRPVAAGAPIRRGDIVKPGDRDFLQVVLPPGTRAIAIPVTTGGASTGLLTPGDHVDVMLTQRFNSDGGGQDGTTPLTRRSVGETIVQNLRVLAINTPDNKAGAAANNGNFGRTVTLQVTPEQAETINVAAELGKLSVTLRSSNPVVASSGAPDEMVPIRPKWAGDVSPALMGAAQPKPKAIKPQPVLVIRGGKHAGREWVDADPPKAQPQGAAPPPPAPED